MDLALVDGAAVVRVKEFDRVFDGNDMDASLAVDFVDDGGQRGGFPAAGGAAHQNEAERLVRKFGHDPGQPEFLKGLDLERNRAKRPNHGAPVPIDVQTEPAQALDAERQVAFFLGFKLGHLVFVHDAVDDFLALFGFQRLVLGERFKLAMEPVRLEANADKVRIDAEIRRLYDHVLIASKYNNIPKCQKILSTYIVRYCDNPTYAGGDVEKLIAALGKRENGFKAELDSSIAIELYYQITRAVLGGDIPSAIQGIRKYGYIFGGDTAAKYFYDIDRLERILYQMITEKGLWNNLKER